MKLLGFMGSYREFSHRWVARRDPCRFWGLGIRA